MSYQSSGPLAGGGSAIGNVDLIGRTLVVWSVVFIASSMLWPRYGYYSLGPLPQFTPFTLMAVATWAILPAVALLSAFALHALQDVLTAAARLWMGFILWFAWRFICAAIGETPADSLLIVARDAAYLLAVFPAAMIVCSTPGGRTQLMKLICLCVVAVLALAVGEAITHRPVVQLFGLQFSIDAKTFRDITEVSYRGGAARLKSVFSHPIVFGQFLAWSAPFVFVLALTTKSHLFRLLACLATPAIFWAVWGTGSRAALLGLVLSTVAFGVLAVVRRTGLRSGRGVIACLVLGAVLTFGIGFTQTGVASLVAGRNSGEAGSTTYRAVMLSKGIAAIQTSPVFGYGEGRAAFHAGFYGRNNVLTIDSAFLSNAVDSGLVGGALMLFAWGSVLAVSLRRAVSASGELIDGAVAAATISVMFVFTILSIWDNLTLILINAAMVSYAGARRGAHPI